MYLYQKSCIKGSLQHALISYLQSVHLEQHRKCWNCMTKGHGKGITPHWKCITAAHTWRGKITWKEGRFIQDKMVPPKRYQKFHLVQSSIVSWYHWARYSNCNCVRYLAKEWVGTRALKIFPFFLKTHIYYSTNAATLSIYTLFNH